MSEFPTHAPKDKELKIILLYIIGKFEKLREMQLNNFVLENGILSYLDLRIALNELVKTEHVAVQKLAYDNLLMLSDLGKEALKHFKNEAANSLITAIDENVPKYIEMFKEQRHIVAEHFRHDKDSSFTAVLGINDNDESLFEIRIHLPNFELAERYCSNWKGMAFEVFDSLSRGLYEREDK